MVNPPIVGSKIFTLRNPNANFKFEPEDSSQKGMLEKIKLNLETTQTIIPKVVLLDYNDGTSEINTTTIVKN